MAANPVREKRDLLFIFGQSNPPNLLVRVAISGEVQVTAVGPGPTDRRTVLLQSTDPSGSQRQYNLLEFAPIDWWRNSPNLLQHTEAGFLLIDAPSQQQGAGATAGAIPTSQFILKPGNATNGDLLVYDGNNDIWVVLPAGPAGQVVASNGPGSLPSYQDPSSLVSVVTNLAMATNEATDSATFIAAGAFPLDASLYTTVRMLSVASVTSGGLTGEVQLYNLTDAVAVTGGTNLYPSITTPTDLVTGALILPQVPKLYELRFRVTGGTPPADRINLAYAGLELTT